MNPADPPAPQVTLRAYGPQDRGLRDRSEGGEFDDHGPAGADPAAALPGSSLDAPGGLVVCDHQVAVGSVSWIYQQWGPTAASRCLMIGIALRPESRGRGVGTQAQRQLVDLIFLHTRIHRVEAATEVANLAEQRSLEKAGFRREGVVREGLWRRGQFRDSVLYSRLRTDPAP